MSLRHKYYTTWMQNAPTASTDLKVRPNNKLCSHSFQVMYNIIKTMPLRTLRWSHIIKIINPHPSFFLIIDAISLEMAKCLHLVPIQPSWCSSLLGFLHQTACMLPCILVILQVLFICHATLVLIIYWRKLCLVIVFSPYFLFSKTIFYFWD